jgi:hypothetical protein
METIINLIIQLVSGVVGGNAAGAALKDYDLGTLGNTIDSAHRRRREQLAAVIPPV